MQFGKVCPGTELCNADLEWALMIIEVFASTILCLLWIPMFTLQYKGGFQGKKTDTVMELRFKKRLKLEKDQFNHEPDKPIETDAASLYDADLEEDDSTLAKYRRKVIHSNLGSLRRFLYIYGAV